MVKTEKLSGRRYWTKNNEENQARSNKKKGPRSNPLKCFPIPSVGNRMEYQEPLPPPPKKKYYE